MSASRIKSVGELREELAKYDDNNLVLLEVRDEWGAVHDYSPFYIDVVEWNNNTEVRLCQIENTRVKY
jgi:hypothetical protein